MRFEEAPELRGVRPRHVGALFVQDREGARDVAVVHRVPVGEHLAADDGVEVVASAPEGPFPAHVGGGVDRGGGLPGEVCGCCVSGGG